MIRVLHAADLHLDSPFDALSEEKAALRRREQRELLRSLARLRAEQRVDIVLLSGDLFDSDAAWAETEELLRLTLSEMAVPVFISPGNHDYYRAGGRWARMRLPGERPRLHLAGLRRRVTLTRWARASGARPSPTTTREGTLAELRIPRQERLHGASLPPRRGGRAGSRYNPMTEREIAATGADYVALGHNHSFSGLRKAGEHVLRLARLPRGARL